MMGETRPRVVFDCMVYLQAGISESGPAAVLLRSVEAQKLSLFVSDEILEEVRDVLPRPKIRRKIPGLTDLRINAFLTRVSEKATVVREINQHFQFNRDPKDEKYINLALEVGAEFLVSRDNDLLDLMKSDSEESRIFQKQFKSLTILDPVDFLAMLAE